MATQICLIDSKNTSYIFKNTGEILINNEKKGIGRLITPIENLSLRSKALFSLGEKKLKTGILKGCLVDD